MASWKKIYLSYGKKLENDHCLEGKKLEFQRSGFISVIILKTNFVGILWCSCAVVLTKMPSIGGVLQLAVSQCCYYLYNTYFCIVSVMTLDLKNFSSSPNVGEGGGGGGVV